MLILQILTLLLVLGVLGLQLRQRPIAFHLTWGEVVAPLTAAEPTPLVFVPPPARVADGAPPEVGPVLRCCRVRTFAGFTYHSLCADYPRWDDQTVIPPGSVLRDSTHWIPVGAEAAA